MRATFFALIAVVSLLFMPSARAQSDSLLKTNDIRILLNLMDVGPEMQRSIVNEIASGRAASETGLPERFWDEFEKEALSSVSAFIERLIPSYDTAFSHAEIKSLIELYQNPVMQKLNSVDAGLDVAATKAGELWGEEIGLRVAMRLDNAEPFEEVKEEEAESPPGHTTPAAVKPTPVIAPDPVSTPAVVPKPTASTAKTKATPKKKRK